MIETVCSREYDWFISWILTETTGTVRPPGGDDGVLGAEAVDGAVLHAEGDHALTLPVLHQQVQGEVLHKVTGVITQGLERHGGDGDISQRGKHV